MPIDTVLETPELLVIPAAVLLAFVVGVFVVRKMIKIAVRIAVAGAVLLLVIAGAAFLLL